MNLRQLRYFVAVAEELHFGRAAGRLNVSQPPLSKQIKELEQSLGVVLLDRNSHGVALTAAGRELYEGAVRLLGDIEGLSARVKQVESGKAGHVSVGFIPSVGFRLMPRIVREFRSAYPAITLTLSELSEVQQQEELLAGRLDLGFARFSRTSKALDSEVLLTEPLLLVLPTGHRLANLSQVDMADCRDEPFIDFPRARAPYLYDLVLRMCLDAGIAPRTAQVANSIYTCLGLVGSGVGIAILPASAMEMRISQVVFRRTVQDPVPAMLSLGWRPGMQARAVANFHAISRQVALLAQGDLDDDLRSLP